MCVLLVLVNKRWLEKRLGEIRHRGLGEDRNAAML